ncbi:MAG: membrane protein insertase YidC, partial [Bacteroidota bacterium]
MNKGTINTILGILIIFGILIGYSLWTAPSKEELLKRKRQQDSTLAVQKNQIISDSIAAVKKKNMSPTKDSTKTITKKDSLSVVPKNDSVATTLQYGQFSGSAKGTNKHYVIEDSLVKIKFAAKGGGISYVELKTYKTFDKKPLILFNTDTSNYNIEFFSDNKNINTGGLYFEPFWYSKSHEGKDSVSIKGSDSVRFGMRLYPSKDSIKDKTKYIEFLYVIRANNYMMHFTINLVNMKDVIAQNNTYLAFDWSLHLTKQEKSASAGTSSEAINTSVYYKPADDKVDYLKENKDDKKEKLPNLKWVSFKQQFFSSTLIAGTPFISANLETMQRKDTLFPRYLKSLSASLTLPYTVSDKSSYPMSFYFGPNHYRTLSKYNLDLERQIPLGWSFAPLAWINRFAVIPVFNVLSKTGMNYGIIILILTILLKIVLLPIAYKTYMSSARMRVLKPEVDEIGQKFPKKEDAMKKQQATMA